MRTPGHSAFAYKGNVRTIRSETHRLIAHGDGHVELYDHRTPEAETQNVAESDPVTVMRLLTRIEARLP